MKIRIGLIFILGIFLCSNLVYSSPNFNLRPSLICSSSIGQKMLLEQLVQGWVAEKGFSITIDVLWDRNNLFLIDGWDVLALVNYSRGIDENGNIEITVGNQYVQDPYMRSGIDDYVTKLSFLYM